jgi:hypothetical protein
MPLILQVCFVEFLGVYAWLKNFGEFIQWCVFSFFPCGLSGSFRSSRVSRT